MKLQDAFPNTKVRCEVAHRTDNYCGIFHGMTGRVLHVHQGCVYVKWDMLEPKYSIDKADKWPMYPEQLVRIGL